MTTAWPSYAELRARRIAARRAAARDALVRMDERVRVLGGRLVVFGSLAEGGFDERSDADVAVMGLPPGDDERFATEVELALGDAGVEADVHAERFLSPSLRERIERNGREPGALG